MEILKAYGVNPNLIRLQNPFWENAKLVCCAGGCHGSLFATQQGITQGSPLSLPMFNVCVDAVVREWLYQALSDDTMRKGIGDDVAELLVAFSIDYGLVASREPVWLRLSFDILVSLFERIGLYTNAAKTKCTTCIPGRIREGFMEEEYTLHRTGAETATNRKRRWVVCQICSASLQAGSLMSHLETQNDVYCLFVLNHDIVTERHAVIYHATASTETGRYFCLVAICIGGASTRSNLCQHFMDCHSQDLVICPSKEPLLRCTRCGMQMAAGATNTRRPRSCAWRGGASRCNMRLLQPPDSLSKHSSLCMGRSWNGSKY